MDPSDGLAVSLIAGIGAAGVLLGALVHALLRRFLSQRSAAGVVVLIGLPAIAALGIGVGMVLYGGWLLLSEPPKPDG